MDLGEVEQPCHELVAQAIRGSGELDSSLEVDDGLVVGEEAPGAVGGSAQKAHGLGPGFGQVEVAGEQVDGVIGCPVERFPRLREATMEVAALATGHPSVRHLDDQRVAEDELVWSVTRRLIQELGGHQLLERSVEIRDLPGHALEQR